MSPLHSPKYLPLPLGSVRPAGWLQNQLRIQAGSLSGKLDEAWADIRDSRWFGGDAEGWERAPYWLDGLIPLAWVLDDPALQAKATRYVEYILDHQHTDGWLGPREMVEAGGKPEDFRYDLWGQLLIIKVLAQYHDATGSVRALDALEACLRRLDRHIDRAPLFNWGSFRWFEGLVGIYYLYERRPQEWLLDLAIKLQAQGFHWGDFFRRWPFKEPTTKRRWNYMSHVVNNAMAVKAHALWWRLSASEQDRADTANIQALLAGHHGQVTGMFSGDECLAGKKPTVGSELCAVVEYAYSLETLLSIFGEPADGDRLEQVIFNALPATFSPDMWSHQYDQQVNQVECSIRDGRPWNTNGPESNLFGLEPNYGCCTANLSQGWPKFAAHLWMRPAEGGLAAMAYAPSRVETTIDGVAVTVELETGYPFRDELQFTVRAARGVRFPLHLRIPAWAAEARLEVPGETPRAPAAGTFCVLEREWGPETRFTLTLPARTELRPGWNGAAALARGSLVFALPIGEDWRQVHADVPGRELPHGDWEVYPTTAWNYALAADAAARARFSAQPIGELPFSPAGAPLRVRVPARRLPGWEADNGSAADVPPSPVVTSEPEETIELVPYGCTNLRITEFPQY